MTVLAKLDAGEQPRLGQGDTIGELTHPPLAQRPHDPAGEAPHRAAASPATVFGAN